MEIVLSEIDLIRKQNISIQQDISTIVGIAKKASSTQFSPPQDIPQVDPEHPSESPQETPSPAQDRPPRPRPQAKTSRHSQTNHPPPRDAPKPSTKTSRPIRHLFPPCPWQTGFYPQGPVRHMPPPFQQPRSQSSASRSKQQNQPKPKTTSDRRANDRYPADSPPLPRPQSSPSACPPPHGPTLIEELPTSTEDPSPPPATATFGPGDRSSLNF